MISCCTNIVFFTFFFFFLTFTFVFKKKKLNWKKSLIKTNPADWISAWWCELGQSIRSHRFGSSKTFFAKKKKKNQFYKFSKNDSWLCNFCSATQTICFMALLEALLDVEFINFKSCAVFVFSPHWWKKKKKKKKKKKLNFKQIHLFLCFE